MNTNNCLFFTQYMLKKRNFINLFLFLILGLGFMACSERPYYQKTYDFPQHHWTNEQKSVFHINIEDTTSVYRFELTVRTTTEYAYNNLWLLWKSKTPNNEQVSEPFDMKITTPEGKWIGKKSGSIVENQLTFADRKMPHAGKYVFTIQQASTEKKVEHVLDIGLKVYKINEKTNNQNKNLKTDQKTTINKQAQKK